ncbi:right-handed parallel beta-helix repeat-containing protein, partial [Candidatus Woesearchaeota archaeon]|nr:right-handed parallel beta-helix repeat-containing protein [Candidatus Woesearchaeota archaeon]
MKPANWLKCGILLISILLLTPGFLADEQIVTLTTPTIAGEEATLHVDPSYAGAVIIRVTGPGTTYRFAGKETDPSILVSRAGNYTVSVYSKRTGDILQETYLMVMETPISVDKDFYSVGDEVNIETVHDSSHEYTLSLLLPDGTALTLMGLLDEAHTFTASMGGVHTAQLTDHTTGQTYSTEFVVIPAETTEIVPETIKATTNISRVSLNNDTFPVGGQVRIHLVLENSGLYDLTIITPSSELTYLGELSDELTFLPSEAGNYTVRLTDKVSGEAWTVDFIAFESSNKLRDLKQKFWRVSITGKERGGKHDLTVKKGLSSIKMRGVKDPDTINTLRFDPPQPGHATPTVIVEGVELESATIQLPKNGPIGKILRCTVDNGECIDWRPTDIPFVDRGYYIEFDVNGFSGFAGEGVNTTNTPTTTEECDDNTCTKTYYSGVMNYYNGSEYIPINSTIESKSIIISTRDYNFGVDKGLYEAYFRDQSSDTNTRPVAMNASGYVFTLAPQDFLLFEPHKGAVAGRVGNRVQSNAITDDDKVTYPDQYDKIGTAGGVANLTFRYDSRQLKEELVIWDQDYLRTRATSQVDPSEWNVTNLVFKTIIRSYKDTDDDNQTLGVFYGTDRVKFKEFGLAANDEQTTSEEIHFTDANNVTVYTIPELYAWDSNDSRILLNKTISMTDFGNLRVDILTPYWWLNDTARVYPIYIDPTTEYNFSDETYLTAEYCEANNNGNVPPSVLKEGCTSGGTDITSNSALDTPNDVSLSNPDVGGSDEDWILFTIDVQESVPDITLINYSWRGKGEDTGVDIHFHVWNTTGNTYIGDCTPYNTTATYVYKNCEYTDNDIIDDVINTSGNSYFMVQGFRSGGGARQIQTDFFEMQVTYNTAPVISNAEINDTSLVNIDAVVKVNASISNSTPLYTVTLQITPPVSSAFNTTPTQNGAEYYNDTIVLNERGQWTFTFYANDTITKVATPVVAQDQASNAYIQVLDCGDTVTNNITLKDNLTATGDCFIIGNDDVIIDGAGYTITGDGGSGDYGVFNDDYNRITVKNLIIDTFNRGVTFDATSGVTSNHTIKNITIKNSSSTNIYVTELWNSTISLITINNSDQTGIFIDKGKGNSILHSWINTTSSTGITISGVDINDTVIRNNTIYSTTSPGIFAPSYATRIEYNHIVSSSSEGISSWGNRINITGNNITSGNSIAAIRVINNPIGRVVNNTINAIGSSKGIEISEPHIEIINNTITTENNDNIRIYEASNEIINVTIENNQLFTGGAYDDIDFLSSNMNGTTLKNQQVARYDFGGNNRITVENDRISISFIQGIDTIIRTNFSRDIRLGDNWAYVNGSISALNKSANITFYNLPNQFNPLTYRDGSLCGSTCTPLSLSGGAFTFNVTGWSNYTIGNNSQLDINNPGGSTDTQITFTANYTNVTSDESINGTGIGCNI